MLVLSTRALAAALLGTSTASSLVIRSSIFAPLSYNCRRLSYFSHHKFYPSSALVVVWGRGSCASQYSSFSGLSSISSRPQRSCPTRSLRLMSSNNAEADTAVDVASNLRDVRSRIQSTCQRCGRTEDQVRLVAVSKTKPVSLLQQAYDAGQRVFGENYVQELIDKVPQMPDDVQWHFIGPLQSNKANKIVQAFVEGNNPQLHRLVIETIASEKLAAKLNHAVESSSNQRLKVMVQVNTSGEESKSGVKPNEVMELCRFVVDKCPNLQLSGVMTIGAEDDVSCFDILMECRSKVALELDLPSLEVSMGMSGDFEQAIEKGATSVRVGSTLFGARDYSK